MRSSRFLLQLMAHDQLIKNINIPSCKNCIYFKPNLFDNEFVSPLSKCHKFGEKNIITDEITFNYADLCRNDEAKCGKDGTYFQEEKNIRLKLLKHKIINNAWIIILSSILFVRFGFY